MDFSSIFAWIILPLLIILARIIDVSIGTLRIIYLHQGKKILVPLLGFFEILIWLIAMKQIMENLTNILYYLAYAAGFAIGNYIGICIEEKLAMGNYVFRIITSNGSDILSQALEENGFGLTTIPAKGLKGDVKIIYTITKRKNKDKIIEIINDINPQTFYTIDDVRLASEEIYPLKPENRKLKYNQWLFLRRRKGK